MASRRGKRGERIEPVMGRVSKTPDTLVGSSDRPAMAGKAPKSASRTGTGGTAGAKGAKSAGAAKKVPLKAAGNPDHRRKSSSQTKTTPDAAATRSPRPSSARKRRKSRRKNVGGGRFTRLLKRGFYWGVVASVWGFIVVAGTLAYFAAQLPQSYDWKVPSRPPNVKIVSAEGRLIANRGETGGEAVRLEQLPKYLPQAVIAIEDRRFRSHFGIDVIGLARAVVTNLVRGGVVQGGSTLTQQLAKNLFLTHERTISRKMQEVVLALWLETRYSKDQILEMYLNRVYFGAGAYGVDGAARRYFGKSARQVTLAEAATLAALLKAPSRYAPNRNPDLAEKRARLVLQAMHDAGFISAHDEKNAIDHPALAVAGNGASGTNYVADWVMDLLPGYIGRIDQDVIVDTTIDLRLQHEAEHSLGDALDKNGGKLGVSQGALVALDTSGAVKALVGGRNYRKSQFNRAVSAERQPGSAFKPFVYLAALEKGLTPDTIRVDQPVSINGWKPKNYTKRYYGSVTLRKALAYSLNTVAAQLGQEVGPKNVAATARRLGITSELKVNPSIALGTSEVTPLEITAAYVPFSNGGWGVIPYVIRSVKTENGKVLYHRVIDGPGQVIRSGTLREIDSMLGETLITGTGKRARLGDRPAGGKTGTSQDLRDAWFIGFTANYTAAVWLGNDDGSPTKAATGGTLPASIWHDFMVKAHEHMPLVELPGIPVGGPVVVRETPRPAPARNVVGGRTIENGNRVLPPPGGNGFFHRLFGGG
ncbi:penicillin-binding protein 1A [Breoghania corrubedonensis]|uniref:Penicillin-binding protein 1A n=1 Tax=Breoghania corrubedonensis TaxID=665038 RepID=A0A2T5VHJ2_9HYPH|nr:PBP1A family penicillin-binding protein [Breoghania corrubedonensis]PTW63222.1 penicillin-binding protein 1A [Breoghania corrubedonensis]